MRFDDDRINLQNTFDCRWNPSLIQEIFWDNQDDEEEFVISEEEEDEEPDEDEEEEGMDWDEMEAKARREDREKGFSSDDESPRHKKKRSKR